MVDQAYLDKLIKEAKDRDESIIVPHKNPPPPPGSVLERPKLKASEARKRLDEKVFENIGCARQKRYVRPEELTEHRLQSLLYLRWKGFTQQAIAEMFGVTPRTIRNWEKKAKQHKVSLAVDLTPEEALGDYLAAMDYERQCLMSERDIAGMEADSNTVLKCTKLIIDLIEKKQQTLERVGLFSKDFPQSRSKSSSKSGRKAVDSENNGQENLMNSYHQNGQMPIN